MIKLMVLLFAIGFFALWIWIAYQIKPTQEELDSSKKED
jgi:cytoskeletal protein RodZ